MNKGLHDGCFCKRWAFSLQKNLENEKVFYLITDKHVLYVFSHRNFVS